MSNGIFTGSITQAKDGSLYIELQSLRVKGRKRFTPAQLLPLREWLNDAKLLDHPDWPDAPVKVSGLRISYSHDDGLIRLEAQSGVNYYDPLKDEDLARLVRHLKARVPIPKSDQPILPVDLPEVTANDLATKRTVYKRTGIPVGLNGKSIKPQPKTREEAAKDNALLDDIMGKLCGF